MPFEEEVPIVFVGNNQNPDLWEQLPSFWNEAEEQTINPRTGDLVTRRVIQIKLPLGLTQPPQVPPENPMTLHKWVLGKKLYYDKILSSDGTVACATCHAPETGFTDQRATSLGIHEQVGGMNAPTVINSAFHRLQFWDGRASSLEDQSQGPVGNPVEMFSSASGDVAWDAAVLRLRASDECSEMFERVFGHAPTRDATAKAIATYERTVLVGNALTDRADVAMLFRSEEEMDFTFKVKPADYETVLKEAVAGGDTHALEAIGFDPQRDAEQIPAIAQRLSNGRELFFGKARCTTCHAGDNFTDGLFHNLGVGIQDNEVTAADLGRFAAEPLGHKDPRQIGAFKTPGLRALLDTAPYMHDGSEATLEAVVEFYDRGGNANEFLDTNMRDSDAERAYREAVAKGEKYDGPPVFLCGPNQVPVVPLKLNLTEQEKKDLVLFMRALQSDPVPEIVADPQMFPDLN